MTLKPVPFSMPSVGAAERRNVERALATGQLGSYGPFTTHCEAFIRARFGLAGALLTQSGTGALDLAAALAGFEPGDEVILASLTYTTTASMLAARGAVPVFVDIRADTYNLDEKLIAAAITPRTRGIVAMHYAGVACAMDEIAALAQRHRLVVIEDAAQAFDAYYKNRPLGAIGDIGVFSFNHQKNIAAGQAGALLINRPADMARAEMLRDCGTDRARFMRGEVAKYNWQELSASTAPSDMIAAVLAGQLERADQLRADRLHVWETYHAAFADEAKRGTVRQVAVPAECAHNAHLAYLIFDGTPLRDAFIAHMAAAGVDCRTHFEPLHRSPGGQRWARMAAPLPVTEATAAGLVRLPIWPGMTDEPARVIDAARKFLAAM